MSRTSRRKTLSHSEIENFLSEINVPIDPPAAKAEQLNNIEKKCPLVDYVPPSPIVDPMLTEVQFVREFSKVILYS